MQKFIGVKMVQAEPMSLFKAQDTLGREICKSDTDRNGYLIQYQDGYKSWCPKDVFEKQYLQVSSDKVTEEDADRLIKGLGIHTCDSSVEASDVLTLQMKENLQFIVDWAVNGLENE